MRNVFILCVICSLLISCGGKDYLHVDASGCAHADMNCADIKNNIPTVAYRLTKLSWKDIYKYGNTWTLCTRCMNIDDRRRVQEVVRNCNDVYEVRREVREREYNALCIIGKKRWDSFEDYFRYVYDDDMEELLDTELENEGWRHGLHTIGRAYSHINDKIVIKNTRRELVLWSQDFIQYIYLNLIREGVVDGSLKWFEEELKDKDWFIWCYEQTLALGLVNDWETFIMRIIEPNYEYCKELFRYEWVEELENDGYYDED